MEQRQTEEDLRASEQRYRSLAEMLEVKVVDRTAALDARHAENVVQAAQLQQLSAELVQAHEEERKRIARALHDSVGQTLTVLGIETGRLAALVRCGLPEAVALVEQVNQLAQQLTQEIRTTSYLLYPPLLEESGLAEALRTYVDGLAARMGMAIRLEASAALGRLPADAEMALFRVVQECLTNVHRHAGSPSVEIRLLRENGWVRVEIEDHGRGIANERLRAIEQGGGGVGMRGMKERLRQVQGELTVRSGEGGTTIIARVPERLISISQRVSQAAAHLVSKWDLASSWCILVV